MNFDIKAKALIFWGVSLFLVACSSEPDPFEPYLGYWLNETDFGALVVTGDDGEYSARYIQTDRMSSSSKELELTVSEGRLFWNTKGMGPRELKLTDGDLILRFEGNRWSRTTREEVERIKDVNNID